MGFKDTLSQGRCDYLTQARREREQVGVTLPRSKGVHYSYHGAVQRQAWNDQAWNDGAALTDTKRAAHKRRSAVVQSVQHPGSQQASHRAGQLQACPVNNKCRIHTLHTHTHTHTHTHWQGFYHYTMHSFIIDCGSGRRAADCRTCMHVFYNNGHFWLHQRLNRLFGSVYMGYIDTHEPSGPVSHLFCLK